MPVKRAARITLLLQSDLSRVPFADPRLRACTVPGSLHMSAVFGYSLLRREYKL